MNKYLAICLIVSSCINLPVSVSAGNGANATNSLFSPSSLFGNFRLDFPVNDFVPYYSFFSGLWSQATNHGLMTSNSTMLSLNIVSVAILIASLFISYFVYPSIPGDLSWMPGLPGNRNFTQLGRKVEEVAGRVNRALNDYANVDTESCLKMAICTVGRARQQRNSLGRAKFLIAADVVDYIVNLTARGLMGSGYREARHLGETGGDCDHFNRRRKCPLDDRTWNLLLSSLRSTLL